MPNAKPLSAEQIAEQKDLQNRVEMFDKEFQALQTKYALRVIAQVRFPGGANLTVPIQVFPLGPLPKETADKVTEA